MRISVLLLFIILVYFAFKPVDSEPFYVRDKNQTYTPSHIMLDNETIHCLMHQCKLPCK